MHENRSKNVPAECLQSLQYVYVAHISENPSVIYTHIL